MRLWPKAAPLLFLLLLSLQAPGYAASENTKLFLEGGAYLPSPGYTAQDNLGNRSLVNPLYAIVGPRGTLPLSPRLQFEPGLRFVLPWHKNVDGNQKYITTLLNFDMGYAWTANLDVHTGVGFQWTWVTGSASTEVQQNGSSSTTFFTPEASESVWIGGLDFGASYRLGPKLRTTFDVTVWEFASSQRRRAAVLVGIDYALF